jgi:tRNA(Ile2) C34 agmatinyltransferase TiaS
VVSALPGKGEDDDEAMVSKAYHDRIVSDLNSKMQLMADTHKKEIAVLIEKLRIKREEEKQKVLCPVCEKRLKYDSTTEEYVCPRDGWRGQRAEAILED